MSNFLVTESGGSTVAGVASKYTWVAFSEYPKYVRIQAQGLKYASTTKVDEYASTLRFEIHSFN